MRTRSLTKTKPSLLSHSQFSDIPSPLHIIKRTKTVEFRPSAKREVGSGSADYGADRPLSVMKKRRRRNLASTDSSGVNNCDQPVVTEEPMSSIGDDTPRASVLSPVEQPSKLPSRLRWFSRQRTSSSGTTCRRYNLRGCSVSSHGSSVEESPGSSLVEEPCRASFESRRGSMQTDTSILSSSASANYSNDCHVLVPRISITPEVHSSNRTTCTVWAAIEISVQLSRPFTDASPDLHADEGSVPSSPLRAGSASRFGYIYDLVVDVLPVPQASILQVIHDSKKRSLSLGSAMLVLAKIKIDRRRLSQSSMHMAQQSDELIADLEKQLRASWFKYLQVRLRYSHSGFTAPDHATPIAGTMDCQTRLETTVNGVIEQQDLHSSMGISRAGTGGSSLFDLVASYWGPIRAHGILSSKSALRQDSYSTVTKTAMPVNKYSTIGAVSRHKCWTDEELGPSTPLAQTSTDFSESSPDQEDPAHRIWSAMRRRSSLTRPNIRTNTADPFPAERATNVSYSDKAATITGSTRMKSNVEQQRDLIRDVALRNKRSIGADSLKSLVPSMMNLDLGEWGSSSNVSDKENVPPGRRKENRWSLGWW